MNRKFYILMFILSLLVYACAKQEKKSSSKERIIEAIEVGFYHPQKAATILDSIEDVSNLDTENKMLYSIANLRIQYNLKQDISKDSTIYDAIDFFEKNNNTKYAGLANYYASIVARSQNNKQKEIEYLQKTIPYTQLSNDSILESRALFNIGVLFMLQEYIDSAAVYYQKAIDCFIYPNQNCIKPYYSLAFMAYVNKEPITGLYNLENAQFLAEKYNDKTQLIYVDEMYGLLYYTYPNYTLSSHFFHKYLSQVTHQKDSVRTFSNLARLHYAMNNNDSTRYYLNMVLPRIAEIKSDYATLMTYNTTKDFYLKIGDSENYEKYTNLYEHIALKIRTDNANDNVLKASSLSMLNSHNKKEQYSHEKIYIYIIVSMIILIILIVQYTHFRYEKKEKQVIKEKMKDIKYLKTQLERLEHELQQDKDDSYFST